MLAGLDQLACQDLAVPIDVMEHVVRVESSFNPLAIGVVGGRLVRQPRTLPEALATVRMLEERGYNFSLGLAQVNRHNLASYGLASYEAAFQPCQNLRAGALILAECLRRSGGDWGKAFSCYYSGNTVTGFRDGYVQKVFASMREVAPARPDAGGIPVARSLRKQASVSRFFSRRTPDIGEGPSGASPKSAMAKPAMPVIPAPVALPATSAPLADAPGRDAEVRDHAFVF